MPDIDENLPDNFHAAIEAAIERHESGACGCMEEDWKIVGGCCSGETELIAGVKNVVDTLLEKEGRGVLAVRDMKNDKQRVVLRGVTRIEAVEFLTNILAEILRETGKGAMRDELVGTVKNVIDDIVYGEND